MSVWRWGAWLVSIGVILAAVVPWRGFTDHAHWHAVLWIPFVSPPVRVLDIAENVVLYLPFGFFYGYAARTRRWRGVIYAVALSLATETTQVYTHDRFPSMTDVTCNVIGAGVGIMIAVAIGRFLANAD